MSRLMGKQTICICKNKGADQLHGNREADQRLCFRYSDSTIPLLLKKVQVGKDQEKAQSEKKIPTPKSEISSF